MVRKSVSLAVQFFLVFLNYSRSENLKVRENKEDFDVDGDADSCVKIWVGMYLVQAVVNKVMNLRFR